MTSLLTRFMQFRNELAVLWRAFMAPETPVPLKALMLLVPLYLISPLDLIPDFVPFAGWLDDVLIVPMMVSWIVGMLPVKATARRPAGPGQVIETTYRRR